MNERVLVLGGGFDQIPLMQALRGRDAYVILVDSTGVPPAAALADEHHQCTWADADSVRAIAVSRRASRLASVCIDAAQTVAAGVSDRLGLPYPITPEQARLTTDKALMKARLAECGVPTARHVLLRDADGHAALSRFDYPAVLKPTDASGSQGVRMVSSADAAATGLAAAMAASPSRTVMLEQHLPGDEVTIDCFVVDGRAHLLQVSRNITALRGAESAIIATRYDPVLYRRMAHHAQRLCQAVADAFGLVDTPLLVQAMADQGELTVLELTARLAGGFKSALIARAAGVDSMGAYADQVLGRRPDLRQERSADFASVNYLMSREGVFDHVAGTPGAISSGIVDAYFPGRLPGTPMEGMFNARSRVGAFLVAGEDAAVLSDREQRGRSFLRVVGDTGEDITAGW